MTDHVRENGGIFKTNSRWFRFYAEALDDPKVQRLPAHLFKTWVNILCIAAKSGGRLPSKDDLAFRLRLSCNELETQLSELILAELIDISADGSLTPHNWAKRQYVSDRSTERVRKFREARAETHDETLRNVSCNVSETPPDTDTDTEADITPLPPSGAEPLDALKAFEAYNAVALRCGLPQASKLTPRRSKSIRARLKIYGLDGWMLAIGNIEKSAFLCGKTEANFRADLDFVCQAKSFERLHDGGYSSVKPTASSKPPAIRNNDPKQGADLDEFVKEYGLCQQ